MANAAAKKAAAAKAASAGLYQPLLIGNNALYIFLMFILGADLGVWGFLGMVVTWGFQFYAYLGILDQAANASGKEKALVGGAHLDLLGLTLLIQYGAALHSTKWFYLLFFILLWGGWTLYSTFRGGGNTNTAPNAATDNSPVGRAAEKRQRRAEKRRQKWS